ncbi:hypothetical protein NDU88_003445 [Pleurodeles waltl]|uniref:Uncharacterized protein n=1 Tax=Pleurodeles waltl TaxID=8319 RepID=A0AAV7QBR3_PLEWA|nr:hypothetical protein NDU88_003445 [Pleurodeles waltl]
MAWLRAWGQATGELVIGPLCYIKGAPIRQLHWLDPVVPPSAIIAQLLNYRDIACKMHHTTYQGNEVAFYPDFIATVQLARSEPLPVKKKLQTSNVQYAMLYLACLRIQYKGKPKSFTTSKEAKNLIKMLTCPDKDHHESDIDDIET